MKCGELIQASRLVEKHSYLPVFHLTDVVLDFEYYLVNQVLPPIERLCDPIEGTDRSRLAECLGIVFFFYLCHTIY
jgi:DNA polymerase elongation subunit (family B)